VAVEDNIGVFAILDWGGRRTLKAANVQVVVADCDLQDYYLGHGDARYLRLDCDYNTLGTPFSHALAHVHIGDDPSPRFALDGGLAGNVVIDFIEFVYRHFASSKWLPWAERLWRQALGAGATSATLGRLPTILAAFKDGQFAVLKNHAADLVLMKAVLRREKDRLFAFHLDGADRGILEYPCGR
jgi:hypothetical protein